MNASIVKKKGVTIRKECELHEVKHVEINLKGSCKKVIMVEYHKVAMTFV